MIWSISRSNAEFHSKRLEAWHHWISLPRFNLSFKLFNICICAISCEFCVQILRLKRSWFQVLRTFQTWCACSRKWPKLLFSRWLWCQVSFLSVCMFVCGLCVSHLVCGLVFEVSFSWDQCPAAVVVSLYFTNLRSLSAVIHAPFYIEWRPVSLPWLLRSYACVVWSCHLLCGCLCRRVTLLVNYG